MFELYEEKEKWGISVLLLLKLDMSKACDRVKWTLLRKILICLVGLVMDCVSTANFAIF